MGEDEFKGRPLKEGEFDSWVKKLVDLQKHANAIHQSRIAGIMSAGTVRVYAQQQGIAPQAPPPWNGPQMHKFTSQDWDSFRETYVTNSLIQRVADHYRYFLGMPAEVALSTATLKVSTRTSQTVQEFELAIIDECNAVLAAKAARVPFFGVIHACFRVLWRLQVWWGWR